LALVCRVRFGLGRVSRFLGSLSIYSGLDFGCSLGVNDLLGCGCVCEVLADLSGPFGLQRRLNLGAGFVNSGERSRGGDLMSVRVRPEGHPQDG